MKHLIIVLVVLIMSSIMVAESVETSNIAAFESKKGSLLIKEYHTVASIKSMYSTMLKLDVLYIKDATTNITHKGLRVEAEETKSYGSNTKSSFLDVDEVESIVRALDYIINVQTTSETGAQQPYREYVFSSKDSFKIGVFSDKSDYTVFASVGSIGAISLFFKYNQLSQIKDQFEAALVKLNK